MMRPTKKTPAGRTRSGGSFLLFLAPKRPVVYVQELGDGLTRPCGSAVTRNDIVHGLDRYPELSADISLGETFLQEEDPDHAVGYLRPVEAFTCEMCFELLDFFHGSPYDFTVKEPAYV